MINKILTMSLVTVMLTSPAYASANNTPNKCPSVASIVSVGLDSVDSLGGDVWAGSKKNSTYDTNENWTFGIMYIEEKSPEKAFEKLSKALTVLVSMNQSPERDKDYGKYVCWYRGNFEGNDMFGAAYTPPGPKSMMKFAK
jgi:hypothetical protein